MADVVGGGRPQPAGQVQAPLMPSTVAAGMDMAAPSRYGWALLPLQYPVTCTNTMLLF